jgi:ribosomal protein S18 acetylase RimI-like enzyme
LASLSKSTANEIPAPFKQFNGCQMTTAEDYIRFFSEKYLGRVAIGVGYNEDLSQIFPFVFQNNKDEFVGIVAMGTVADKADTVYLYHIGVFETRCGNGSRILKELCKQADEFDIALRASAIVLPDGKRSEMTTEQLIGWYEKFGFEEDQGLLRNPEGRDKDL